MNDEAYRIFGLTPGPHDVGRPFSEVLHDRPAIIRVLASAFELSHLPNRAELRLIAGRSCSTSEKGRPTSRGPGVRPKIRYASSFISASVPSRRKAITPLRVLLTM
jgi:hypothetical protein